MEANKEKLTRIQIALTPHRTTADREEMDDMNLEPTGARKNPAFILVGRYSSRLSPMTPRAKKITFGSHAAITGETCACLVRICVLTTQALK